MTKSLKHIFWKAFICSGVFTIFFLTTNAQTQTQTKITKFIYRQSVPLDTVISGYLESLPVTYSTDTAKKFPLIVFLHGAGAVGTGSQTDLNKVATDAGVPKVINSGNFPTSFKVNGEDFSFIVISPQFRKTSGVDNRGGIRAMIDSAKKLYRVDTSRIYLTGLSFGGVLTWGYESSNATSANRIAASVMVCPSVDYPFYTLANTVATSNLPIWTLSNYGDLLTPRAKLQAMTDTINYFVPDPLAKLRLFPVLTNTHDAWTRAYNPDSSWDGSNVYEWLLRYTNKKLVANAGQDQAITFPGNSTVTLDGSLSTARQGKITAYLWTKISGPSGGTITSTTSKTTTVTGIDTGSYRFELKVTHTDATTARDTVLISTQIQTKITKQIYQQSVPSLVVIGGYLQSLPVNYDIDTAKKYPLLIFLHALEEMGNGSQSALDTVTKRGLPKWIREGKFPALVNANGKDYSFIVISPQFNTTQSSSNAIQAMIDSCRKIYRVDTSRIYLTGMSQGGILGFNYLGGTGANKVSASLLVRPTWTTPLNLGTRPANIAGANLPLWISSNYNDPTSYTNRSYMKLAVDSINLFSPDPLTKLTILDTAGAATTDAWTKTYNPLTKFWSDSVNVYQWMLSYTRPQGSPRKAVNRDTAAVQQNNAAILHVTANPNPVRSSLTVWITGKAKGKSSLTVYNMQGQRLSQQAFVKDNESPISRVVNAASLPAGYYVIQVIVNKKNTRLVRFVKE